MKRPLAYIETRLASSRNTTTGSGERSFYMGGRPFYRESWLAGAGEPTFYMGNRTFYMGEGLAAAGGRSAHIETWPK